MARSLVLIKTSTVHSTMPVENQCKDVGHAAYNYEIEVTALPALDAFGFLIDHTILHNVIKDVIQNKMGSCEQLCLRVEEAVLVALKEHGVDVQKLVFSIKPVDSNAWIRIEGEYGVVREIKPLRIEKLRKLRETDNFITR